MRYSATEKLEIIHLVEQSPLPARHTLAKLGIARATFYRWYDRYRPWRAGGVERSFAAARSGVEPHPRTGTPADASTGARRASAVAAELAVRFTDTQSYFVSEASVYRLLKAHELIASPAFIASRRVWSHIVNDEGDAAHLGDKAGCSASTHPCKKKGPIRGDFVEKGRGGRGIISHHD